MGFILKVLSRLLGKGAGRPPPPKPPANTPTSKCVGKCARQLTASEEKAIRSLEKRAAEHQEKLDNFRNNPTVRPGMEGQPQHVIQAQQQARINHLQQEINNFRRQIDNIRGGS